MLLGVPRDRSCKRDPVGWSRAGHPVAGVTQRCWGTVTLLPPALTQVMDVHAGSSPFFGTNHPGRVFPAVTEFRGEPRVTCRAQAQRAVAERVGCCHLERHQGSTPAGWGRLALGWGALGPFWAAVPPGCPRDEQALPQCGHPRASGVAAAVPGGCTPPSTAVVPPALKQTPSGKEQAGAVPTSSLCPRPRHLLLRTSSPGGRVSHTGIGVSRGTPGVPQDRDPS